MCKLIQWKQYSMKHARDIMYHTDCCLSIWQCGTVWVFGSKWNELRMLSHDNEINLGDWKLSEVNDMKDVPLKFMHKGWNVVRDSRLKNYYNFVFFSPSGTAPRLILPNIIFLFQTWIISLLLWTAFPGFLSDT